MDMKASKVNYENCLNYVNILHNQIKQVTNAMLDKCKFSTEKQKMMNQNEVTIRKMSDLKAM